jgi:hypothetical protein
MQTLVGLIVADMTLRYRFIIADAEWTARWQQFSTTSGGEACWFW